MLNFDNIPKEIRWELKSALITFDWEYIEKVIDENHVVPSDYCQSCGFKKRAFVFEWLNHVKNRQPKFFTEKEDFDANICQ